ncbi:uncharacterized protein IAS62_001534 [Cryptococcus decagattii]|uniref:TauD/TfdA-like domain-containing protein n=1 Tax=Cryptococcus decagattii TaxID=1859122 RepID=A0ABZ2ASD2_9TREE
MTLFGRDLWVVHSGILMFPLNPTLLTTPPFRSEPFPRAVVTLSGLPLMRPTTVFLPHTEPSSKISLPPTSVKISWTSTSPVTGWKGLFVNRVFTKKINELTQQESDSLLEFLFEHVTGNHDIQVRFRWEENNLAIWDNRCTFHAAT